MHLSWKLWRALLLVWLQTFLHLPVLGTSPAARSTKQQSRETRIRAEEHFPPATRDLPSGFMVRAAMPQADDDINLGFLSDGERELILEVLQRDEELRHAEEHRVRNLKNELLEVKRKGAKRGSGRYSPKSCGRCQESLSRLTLFSSQCDICKHHVCRKCRVALPGGSWLCNVCAKESDIKKRTGDWFYDQRINRFSTKPGHDLVRASLKKRPLAKKRETTAEKLLRSSESNPEPLLNANPPVPRARQRNQTTENKRHSKEGSGSVASRESFESKEEVLAKPTRGDAESAENNSLSSSSRTESVSVTSEKQRTGNRSAASSPSGSSVSSLTSPLKADRVDGVSLKSNADQDVKPVSPNPETDVERLFKKSVKRAPKVSENVSTLDLRDGRDKPEAKMGTRSQSVPGLDTEEDGEEDEDIDSLVNFHKRTMASSTYSLNSSKNTLGSLMSVYSEAGDFDSVEVSGEVVFTLSYDEHTQSLLVFIEECRGLAYGDASGQHSHPYVKCYLLPDKSRQSKRKTSTKRNTVDPVYKETLRYSISRSQLFTRSLSISVWHHGRLSRNAFLGEVEVPLDTRDLDTAYTDHMALRAKSASAVTASAFAQYKGELVISLKYVTSKKPTTEKTKGKKAVGEDGGELHVFIKEAKNLMAMKPGGTSDSFVKGYLHPSKAKSTKRKTPVVKKNLNPHYDHTFVYKEVSLSQLEDMCLELTVWDREAMSSNEFLGGVRLSSGKGSVKTGKVEVELDSVGEEVSLWEKMMQYPDSWAEGTLPLRSTMLKGK